MCPILAARQSVRPSAGKPARSRSVPVGRSRPEPAVPSAACRPRHPGAPGRTGSARRPCADRRAWRCARAPTCAPAQNTPCPMMNWPRRERAPRLAPSAQVFGAQGGSGRRCPSRPRAPARSRRRRTGPAQTDRLHQRQKSAVKLQIWHAAPRRRAKWHRTETKSILPAQRPRNSAQSLESAGPAGEGEARFERVRGIWCGRRSRALLLYPLLDLGPRISNYVSGLVELGGLEPPAPCLQTGGSTSTGVHRRRSQSWNVHLRPFRSVPVAVLSCCTHRPVPQQSRNVAAPPAASLGFLPPPREVPCGLRCL
jgi:hypothetical protein